MMTYTGYEGPINKYILIIEAYNKYLPYVEATGQVNDGVLVDLA